MVERITSDRVWPAYLDPEVSDGRAEPSCMTTGSATQTGRQQPDTPPEGNRDRHQQYHHLHCHTGTGPPDRSRSHARHRRSQSRGRVVHRRHPIEGDQQAVPVAKVGHRRLGMPPVPQSASIARRWHRASGTLRATSPRSATPRRWSTASSVGTTYRVDRQAEVRRIAGPLFRHDAARTRRRPSAQPHVRLVPRGVGREDQGRSSGRRSSVRPMVGSGPASRGPLYQLWLGDQLYVDDPWKHGWKPTIDPHREIITRYRVALGLTPHPSALPTIFWRRGSNHFIPDDHEFWNNYPRASLATLPVHTSVPGGGPGEAVLLQLGPRSRTPTITGAGDGLRAPPSWPSSRPTPEGFGDFAPVGVSERSADHRVRRCHGGHGRHPLAPHDGAAGRVTGRARFLSRGGLRSAGRADPRTGPPRGVLGLAKPIVGALSPNGWFNESLEVGPEDYRAQYKKLWKALNRRADRRSADRGPGR